MMEFGRWFSLDEGGVQSAPTAPGALQVRRADGLVSYPHGKSAMVFYAFVQHDLRSAVQQRFANELSRAGMSGQGPLLFRWAEAENAREQLEVLLTRFEERFGDVPVLQANTQGER